MKLNLKWVSEAIGDQYKSWKSGDCVLIESQTGTGKTHFIKNQLTRFAYSKNKKILYVCNRLNLKRQVKKDICKLLKIDTTKITTEKLDERETFGNVTIVSYQSISKYLQKLRYGKVTKDKYSNFDYIVMDECHHLFQDASFNNKTVFFFEDFLRNYNKAATVVFISATMQHIRKPIVNYYSNFENCKIWEYNTGRDYSYCDVFYFKDNKDIINTINNDTSGDRWLVFINNNEVADEMLSKINGSKFICAERNEQSGKMDLAEKENIILNDQFDCKCIIATKALDNGINIDDIALKHIVIITLDEIDFIQMLGRKRINITNAQRINVYIKQRSKKTFKQLLQQYCKPGQEIIDLFLTDPISFNIKFDVDYKKLGQHCNLFFKDVNNADKWTINLTALAMFRKQKAFYELMKGLFELDKENAFIKQQLSWINRPYSETNWIEEVVDNSKSQLLEEYLENLYINQVKLFEKEQEELKLFISKDFDQMILKLQGRHKDREAGIKILNKLFVVCDIGYIIKTGGRQTIDGNKLSYWVVEKI